MRRMRFGVAARLMAGLAALALFLAASSVIAVRSFNELQRSFDRVASGQLEAMIAAGRLQQQSQLLAGLAPSLFVRGLTQGTLLSFTLEAYTRQGELSALIGQIKTFIGDSASLSEIDQASAALFDNFDALSTSIYAKAAAEGEVDQALMMIAEIHRHPGSDGSVPTSPDTGPRESAADLRSIALPVGAAVYEALATRDPARLHALREDLDQVLGGTASASSGSVMAAPQRLVLMEGLLGERGLLPARLRLDQFNREARGLLLENEKLSADLIGAVDELTEEVRSDIAAKNQAQAALLSTRSRILEGLVVLGLVGAGGIASYVQLSVIRRFGRLRHSMLNETSGDTARQLAKGRDEISEMAGAFVHFVDEINRRDQDIRISQQRLVNAIESISDGFALYDAADLLLVFNSRYREMMYPSEKGPLKPGTPFETLVRDAAQRGLIPAAEGRVEEWVKDRLERHRTPTGSHVQQRADSRWVRISERKTDEGGTVAVYADITEIMRTEEALRIAKERAEGALRDLEQAQESLIHSEKMASLGQLTAGIAHEIKNPLNFVNNFAEVSKELVSELSDKFEAIEAIEAPIREEISELCSIVADNLTKIHEHGRRADGIVRSMLLHAREDTGSARPIELNALIEESLNLAYHGARAENQSFNITLERDLDPEVGEVTAFPQELTRVFLNLFSNGFYATEKRRVQRADASYEPVLEVTTRNLGDEVQLRVRDNGTGIPPGVVDKIFNPFFTTQPPGEGTGLGLSLSYETVVRQHHGRFEVKTKEGQFTEFVITLPRSLAAVEGIGGAV